MSKPRCGARADGGPCVLPAAHNMGQLDVPSNHRAAEQLNSADWERIEAALHHVTQETEYLPAGPAYARTLDKVQSKNLTGKYTPQGGRK